MDRWKHGSKSKLKSVLLSHSTQHHTHAFGGDTGHTHTHADEVAGEIFLLPLTHPEVLVLPQGAPGAVGSLLRRTGTRPSVQSNLGQGQDRRAIFFCLHVFVLGFYVEETPCEHRENMQTPHRNAREIAHMSTGGLGRTCPAEPTAPHAGIEPMTFLL